jgi:hypothetical protein
MSFSPPVGLFISVVRWLNKLLKKKLFFGTYLLSHKSWAQSHQLGAHWESCGDTLEYSLYLAQQTDPEPRTSKIAFRAKGECVKHLSFIFEASSDVSRFQERVTLVNLSKKAIVRSMTNIPYQRFLGFHDQIGPRFAWDEYTIRDVRITLQEGTELQPFDMLASSLTHAWFLQSEWTYKWDRYWNLDAIQWATHKLAQYWRFSFGMPSVRIYSPHGSSTSTITLTHVIAIITRPIAWLMTRKSLIAVQFWFLIWSRLCVLNDESELQWRWRRSK